MSSEGSNGYKKRLSLCHKGPNFAKYHLLLTIKDKVFSTIWSGNDP